MDYRARFYEKYASIVQSVREPVTPELAARWTAPYERYLQGWLPQDKGAPIVDVGCGTGRFLHLLSRLGYQNVTGVDLSPEMVQLARRLHADVVEADTLDHLAKHPNRYDLILAIDIIEHMTKEESMRFLDLCHAALRPNGRIIVQTPNGESIWRGENLHGDFTHEMCLNPKSLRQLLTISRFGGFEARELGPVPHGVTSFVRYLLWQLLRLQTIFVNLVETGEAGSGVYTRVFVMSAVKSV